MNLAELAGPWSNKCEPMTPERIAASMKAFRDALLNDEPVVPSPIPASSTMKAAAEDFLARNAKLIEVK